jgi:small conductance mechanosensitive channel
VAAAIAIYIVGIWIIRKIKGALARLFINRETDPALASFVKSIVSITLTIILILVTIGTLGINTSSIAALLTGGSLAIGLALNGTVQNFAGGIMILAFKPFKVGDFIETQDYIGTVSEVTITNTKLRTSDNRIIIIPNGVLSNSIVNNYSQMSMRRLEIKVNVEYNTSSEQVNGLLRTIIEEDPRSLNQSHGAPSDPFVGLSALLDSSVEYTIRVWVKADEYWGLHYALMERIYNELPKHGVNFPYPKMDITIKQS